MRRARAADEILECEVDGPRVRPAPGKTRGLFQQVLIEHKIHTFHVYGVCLGAFCGQDARQKITRANAARVRLHRVGVLEYRSWAAAGYAADEPVV